jgi:phosphatidate cytidylyltransferase
LSDVPASAPSKGRNLAVRVATAFLLLPLICWLIALGGWPFAGLIAVTAGLCTQEVYAMLLAQPAPRPIRLPPVAWVGVALSAALPVVATAGDVFIAAPLFTVAFLAIAFAAQVFGEGDGAQAIAEVPRLLFGFAYGTFLPTALVLVRHLPNGAWWVVLACTVTWMNDTGAYFVGHAIGKHKLAPRISPGKTWEGFAGGLCFSVIFGYVVKVIGLHGLEPVDCLAIGVGAGLLGPFGDLSESLLKRGCGVKDSGVVMPGHGGMLDRIDALIWNAPFIYLYAVFAKGLPWH